MNDKIEQLIKRFFSFFHIELSDKFIRSFIQFVKFGIVGLSNTVISYALYALTLLLLSPLKVTWDYFVGNIISFVLSVLWSFYWNNRYVFIKREGEKRSLWKSLAKTYMAYGFSGLILSNILSWVWINMLGISKYIAPILNLIISVPVNFLLNKLWAFKSEGKI